MGSWGYEPFDSDDAGDFAAEVAKPIHKVLRHRPLAASRHYQAARAAIAMLMSAGTYYYAGDAVIALKKMLADEGWIKSWRDPDAIAATLRAEVQSAQTRVAEYEAECARARAKFKRLRSARKPRKVSRKGRRRSR